MDKRKSRRVLWGSLCGVLILAWIGLMLYSLTWEPYWLKVERNVIAFDGGGRVPAGLKIVHLSDIHRSDIVPDSYISGCVSKVNGLEPDIVFLTGDYITGRKRWIEGLGELLAPLEAGMGVWAVPGNHDGGKWAAVRGGPTNPGRIREELERAGIGVLENESVRLQRAGVPFTVVGMGDLWSGSFDSLKAFQGIDPGQFVICLTHNPDTLRMLRDYPVDLFLCGHTHGGQVCLPFVGAPLLPVEDTRYSGGLYRLGRGFAYVNRGVGLLRKVRFNCRPEIALFEVACSEE